MVYFRRFLEAPIPLLVLDCGSISTSNTLRPEAARYVARLMAVVVLLGRRPAPWTVSSPGFCAPPSEPCLHLSAHTALQSFLRRMLFLNSFSDALPDLACMDCPVACFTHHKCFSSQAAHG